MRTIAAFGILASLASPAVAQEGMSCEAWNEANDQPLKIVSEIKDWIVEKMRSEGRALAVQTVKGEMPLSDFKWATDTQLLAALNDWCRTNPGDRLGSAARDAAFALAGRKALKNSD